MSKVTGMIVADSVSGMKAQAIGSSPSYLGGPLLQDPKSLPPCPKCSANSLLARPEGLNDSELAHYTVHLKPIKGTPSKGMQPLYLTYADFQNLGQNVPVFRCMDCGFAYNAEGVFHPGDCEGYTINPVDGLGDPLGELADNPMDGNLCPVQLCPISDALHLLSIQTKYEEHRVQLCMATAYMLWLENEVDRLRQKHGDGTGAPLPKETPYTEGLYNFDQPAAQAPAAKTLYQEDVTMVAAMMISSAAKELSPGYVMHPKAHQAATASLEQLIHEKGMPSGYHHVTAHKKHNGGETMHMLIQFPGDAPADFSCTVKWALKPEVVIGGLLKKAKALLSTLTKNFNVYPCIGTVDELDTALNKTLDIAPGITGATLTFADPVTKDSLQKDNAAVLKFFFEGELNGHSPELYVIVQLTKKSAEAEYASTWEAAISEASSEGYGLQHPTITQTFSAGSAEVIQSLSAKIPPGLPAASGELKLHADMGTTLHMVSLMEDQNKLAPAKPLTIKDVGSWPSFYLVDSKDSAFAFDAAKTLEKQLNSLGYEVAGNSKASMIDNLSEATKDWVGVTSMETHKVSARPGGYLVTMRIKLMKAAHVHTVTLRVFPTTKTNLDAAESIASQAGPVIFNHTSDDMLQKLQAMLVADIEKTLELTCTAKGYSVQSVAAMDGYPHLDKQSGGSTVLKMAVPLRLIDRNTGKAMTAMLKGTYPIQKIIHAL